MTREKPTRTQRSIARRTETAERLSRIAERPETPWLLSKLATLEAWRQRPGDFEVRMAKRVDEARKTNQVTGELVIVALGQLQRARAGEPLIILPSDEVARFAEEQRAIERGQAIEPPPATH